MCIVTVKMVKRVANCLNVTKLAGNAGRPTYTNHFELTDNKENVCGEVKVILSEMHQLVYSINTSIALSPFRGDANMSACVRMYVCVGEKCGEDLVNDKPVY